MLLTEIDSHCSGSSVHRCNQKYNAIPMSMSMMELFLWETVLHYHGIDFWTAGRFDCKFLLVYLQPITYTAIMSPQSSIKWPIRFFFLQNVFTNVIIFILTATTNIFESGFHSTKQLVPCFVRDSGVRRVITIGTHGYYIRFQ